MRATRSEQALRRLLAWLRWSGCELTPELECTVLQVLAEAVAAAETDLFSASLRGLQDCGVLSADAAAPIIEGCPAPMPPLRRSSISYGSY